MGFVTAENPGGSPYLLQSASMGNVSSTSAPDTAAAPAVQQPAARRGFGSLRSMVLSMVVIMAAVLAWVAMVPRVPVSYTHLTLPTILRV